MIMLVKLQKEVIVVGIVIVVAVLTLFILLI